MSIANLKQQKQTERKQSSKKRKENDEVINVFLSEMDGYLFGEYRLRPARFITRSQQRKRILSDRQRLLDVFNKVKFKNLTEWEDYIDYCFYRWYKCKLDSNAIVGFVCSEKILNDWIRETKEYFEGK